MSEKKTPAFFGREHASSYDKNFARLSPVRDALHLSMRFVLGDLPAEASVLCVGAGTGAELLDLARAFPAWRFTALDPSAPMLDLCRQKAKEAGFAGRCTFHEGYLDSLPASEPFDAATSILVSQFLLQPEERREFFQQIATRLRPGGYLISADLASDVSGPVFERLFSVWGQMLLYTGTPAERIEALRASYGRDVAVRPPQEVASLIEAGGFDAPTLFFQFLLIHAWFAKRVEDLGLP